VFIGDKIHQEDTFVSLQGVENQTNEPVIITCGLIDHAHEPGLKEFNALYKHLRKLPKERFPKLLSKKLLSGGIPPYLNAPCLTVVFKQPQGPSLKNHTDNNKVSLKSALELTEKIASALHEIHRVGIIHCRLHPDHIILNPDKKNIYLTGFGPFNPQKHPLDTGIDPSTERSPMLSYISPELTGRLSCSVDHRCDLYSLGIIFFELVFGRLPFISDDPSKIIHSHLAKDPFALFDSKEKIPSALIKIGKKLLSKDPRNRYSSAASVTEDLKNGLKQLETDGAIDDFPLDRMGDAPKFRLTQKFYGRSSQLADLHGIFLEKKPHKTKMILVSGSSGIGKTSFIQAFCREIQREDHHSVMVISGKYDQFQQTIPYFALAEALKQFVQQSLTKNSSDLEGLRDKIAEAVGSNGQLMVDMIPELTLIIGSQTLLPVLDIIETQNRFITTFIRFFRSIVRNNNELVLFLDDLQWVDPESLQILKMVLVQGIPNLFIIGAFRNEEINPAHILHGFINEIIGAGIPLEQIAIGPLDKETITRIIADSSKTDRVIADPLAKIILERTKGNPFYIKEYVHSLFHLNHLKYDLNQENWEWDISRIRNSGKTGTLQELTENRIATLGSPVIRLLQKAACLGNKFDCHDLAIVCDEPLPRIKYLLKEATKHELIAPFKANTGDEIDNPFPEGQLWFQFNHDGIQLAVYHLIPEFKRAKEHLNIGVKLYQSISCQSKESKFLDAAAQMNLGRTAIKEEPQKTDLAKINLKAAQMAKKTAAYHTAFAYVTMGIELLGEAAWQGHYDLTLNLYTQAVETSFLCLKFSSMEKLAEKVIRHAHNPLDRMKVYEIIILTRTAGNALPEAIEVALEALGKLGEKLPSKPHKGHILYTYLKTRFRMINRSPDTLATLPAMENPKAIAAVRLYSHAFTAAYIAAPMYAPLFMFRIFLLTIKYGNPPMAPFVYALYGMMLCGSGDIQSGLKFARLATSLLKRDEFKSQSVRTRLIVNCYAKIWQHHPKNDLAELKDGLEHGLASGDFEYAAFSIHMYCGHCFYIGRQLADLDVQMRRANQEIKILHQETVLNINRIFHQTVLNLLGKSNDPCRLEGDSYSEEKMFPLHQSINHNNAFCIAYLNKMRLCYLFYNFEDAFKYAHLTEKYLDAVMGSLLVSWFHFYDSLVQISVYKNKTRKAQKKILVKVGANQKKMKKWAQIVPINHQHTYLLVEAEKARILGMDNLAMDFYNQAINLAGKHDYPHDEALAWELATRFYNEKGLFSLATAYLSQALICYEKWGANAKLVHLKKNFPHLFGKPGLTPCHHAPSASRPGSNLDLSSMIKASEAIAKETVITRLMDKLMAIVLENAGAHKGFLILKNNHGWNVEARVDVEGHNNFTPQPVEQCRELPVSMVRYVRRGGQDLVLAHAALDSRYEWDDYVRRKQLKSALCIPIRHQGSVSGVLYLENNNIIGVFTPERVDVLKNVSRILANAWARNQAEKELLQYQDQLRSLSSQLLLVEEKERRRMAVALHDNIGHALSSAVMELEKLKNETEETLSPRLETIHAIIDESIRATHTLTFELSPPLLYDLGLAAALDWLAEKTTKQYEIPVRFKEQGTFVDIDESTAILLFQSVREVLFNMVKHAKATQATIFMKNDGSDLEIAVEDDGKGFDASHPGAHGDAKGGFGLFSIQERLGSQGGYMEIDSIVGQGTRITLVSPLESGNRETIKYEEDPNAHQNRTGR
jgi:predicted ATPase/signal transduction histidine kinase